MNLKKSAFSLTAILLLFMTTGAGTFENPAIQSIMEAFPQVSEASIRMMITLPCLTSMLSMLVSGCYVGTHVRYRTITLMGSLLILFGGILPFFIAMPWDLILVCRAILGIGVGFCSVRNALLIQSVPENRLARFIGYGNVISSFTVVVLSPVVGMLTNIGWQFSLLCNLYALVCALMIVFFLKEPAMPVASNPQKAHTGALPKVVYAYVFIQFIATCILYPLLSGISSYFSEIGIQDATLSGLMISLYTSGGVVSNLLLPHTEKIYRKWAIPAACFFIALGNGLVILGNHIVPMAFGIFLSGFHFSIITSLLQVYNGRFLSADLVAKSSTMILAANQLGIFLSSYFIEIGSQIPLFQIEFQNVYFLTLLLYIGLGFICLCNLNRLYKSGE